MPYKDPKKQKEYSKQQQDKKWIEKYAPIVQKMEEYNIKNRVVFWLKIHGATRTKIYKNFNIPFSKQIEQEIRKIQRLKYHLKQKPNIKKRTNNQWGYIQKWMTNRGCDCGENNITKLSFHHLDPKIKNDTIRKMCGYSINRILAELKKGVVKCKNCHTIIHAGTSEEREETLINQYLNCHISKKHRQRNKLMIWEYKKTLSCAKCGINDPVILLFHHINSKDKHKKVSVLYKSGRGTINKEIAKTTCLCHNCHENFHYIYGKKTNKKQLEQYIGKKIIPLEANIQDYLPLIEQNISEYYDLSFLIT